MFDLSDPEGMHWVATVFTGGDQGAQLSFQWSAGPLAGKTTLAIYEISAGAVTQHAVVGVDPVGTTQANWKDAESELLVLQLAKW